MRFPRVTARAVLLDLEPKVVDAVQRQGGGRWHYSKAALLTRQSGAGNNWVAGANHAPALRQQVLGMLRRQVERCDSLSGFLIMQVRTGALVRVCTWWVGGCLPILCSLPSCLPKLLANECPSG